MAKTLTFDTGVEEFNLNGAITVRFNPTDAEFVERMYKTFTDLESQQGEFQKSVDEIGEDGTRMFAYAKERDAEMRGLIDDLLGEGVSDAVFPNMNCYALAEGLPVWMNLMMAIAETIHDAFTEEQKKGDPRITKFSKKYESTIAKYKKKK